AESISELRRGLTHRVNFVVAKAAKLAAELHAHVLVPELVDAFDRLMQNPSALDKTCAATTEIVTALYSLDYVESQIYRRGARHIQMEPPFGKPVDAAAKLRAQSALGLARTRDPQAIYGIVSLLCDPEVFARVGAARALAARGDVTSELLLRLKVLSG